MHETAKVRLTESGVWQICLFADDWVPVSDDDAQLIKRAWPVATAVAGGRETGEAVAEMLDELRRVLKRYDEFDAEVVLVEAAADQARNA